MKNSIIGPLNVGANGIWMEGIIDDTSLPGTLMEVTPGSTPVNGRQHYRHYQPGADGDPKLVIVLTEDCLQGFTYTQPYAVGTRCFLYIPNPGDEMNVLFAAQAGTGSADAVTIGERLIGQSSTGQLVVQSDATKTAIFQSLEHIDGPADTPFLVYAQKQ